MKLGKSDDDLYLFSNTTPFTCGKKCDTVTLPASTPINRAVSWHFFHRECFVVLSTMDRAADKMQMNASAD